ncbi:MAG: hypothetical protein ABGX16_01810 [Pirellulales bacterium]
MKRNDLSRREWLASTAACGLAISGGSTLAQELALSAKHDRHVTKGMIFLHHADPRFLEGLRRHGLLVSHGLRLLNTGLEKHQFGEKWAGSIALATAQSSGDLYYIDRICGGMPYQSLEGIESIARELKDDPRFLGFQVHEWGNSPIHDYERIHRLLLDNDESFDREHFAQYEGRVRSPYFSGGDYGTYQKIFEPLKSLNDVDRYLEGFFRKKVEQTYGQVVSVTGYRQLHHTALRLGAKNVMPEIGNQVPLTALQIAFARGAAREYDRPFGVYYEPWGGLPFGCSCALDFSPWFPDTKHLKKVMDGYKIGPEFGSSRSLQRRLLFFAWLSGASYWAEEWGAENYFGNWEDYPLTEYGRIVKDFLAVSSQYTKPKPVVPAAIVMPPKTFGVDISYVAGQSNKLYRIADPDAFHKKLRAFASDLFASQPTQAGGDADNLTPSPWIGCFDVLSAEAPKSLLDEYGLLVYFDREQADKSPASEDRMLVYDGEKQDAQRCIQSVEHLLPYRVKGRVGVAHARTDGRYLLGIFNNLGITKTKAEERADPKATQTAVVHGPPTGAVFLEGKQYTTRTNKNSIEIRLPAGEVAVLSFPAP